MASFPDMPRRSLAEFIGTFALVFAGTGAIITNDLSGRSVTHIGIALTFGLVVMAMIYAVGPVSGAHFNPAVSLGFWLAGRLPGRDVLGYASVQFVAAILASGVLRWLFPTHLTLGVTVPAGSASQAFALEGVITFFLMFVILRVATGAKEEGVMADVAIGATVALAALMAGPISGASMNPARSLGPAIVSGHFRSLWLYLLAPALGSASAALAFRVIATPSSLATEPK